MDKWKIYDPDGKPAIRKVKLPAPPPWRRPGPARQAVIAKAFCAPPELVSAVNVALHLRRPLLITGQPGAGKSSLVHAVARWLHLGEVLVWAINSRSTLAEGLYRYDALARLQAIQERQAAGSAPRARGRAQSGTGSGDDIGDFIALGPLGSALAAPDAPRALLIDEIDKSDIDLPNDLLNVLDTGSFPIAELQRVADSQPDVQVRSLVGPVTVEKGSVHFSDFPFIVMTSNGERDFPAPFLRRCVQCELKPPDKDQLNEILLAHRDTLAGDPAIQVLLGNFLSLREQGALATDQMLNAQHLASHWAGLGEAEQQEVMDVLFKSLDG
jgi:MoxR-like ATPase